MNFKAYLGEHLKQHPAALAQDVIKLCYQAAFGAEHLLTDVTAAKRYFDIEYEQVPPAQEPLYEMISDSVCRIHLGAWKARSLPKEWLLGLFLLSSTPSSGASARFGEYLSVAARLLHDAEFEAQIKQYLEGGIRPVHHSDAYKRAYHPAYRVVDTRRLRLLPILQCVATLHKKSAPCIVAIDGRAASGKSTVAAKLAAILDAAVIHMDDFFLPSSLRTDERFATPGGNVHYERFAEQVLPHLGQEKPFSYRRFDCSVMDWGDLVSIESKPYRIVEGCYSMHPYLGAYADVTVFSDVSSKEQARRILQRDGALLAETFHKRWIPMEEAYFKAYLIQEKAMVKV